MTVATLRRISETIVDFGEPVVAPVAADDAEDRVREAFETVIMVWNAHVMASPRWGQPRRLDELRRRAQDPQAPAPLREAVRTLSRRRAERFAGDLRAVGDWRVWREDGRWRLRCDARVPFDGH